MTPSGLKGLRGIELGGPRVDVLDEHGAFGRAVALPQLAAVLGLKGGEEKLAADCGEADVADKEGVVREGAVRPGGDVLHQDRALGRPVALPQLAPMVGFSSDEKQRSANVNESRRK